MYYLVPKKLQWAVLLIASYGFYLSTGTDNLAYIIFTTLFTYCAGRFMQRQRNKSQKKILDMGEDVSREKKREIKKITAQKVRTIQIVTALINLGVLVFVKTAGFFTANINQFFDFFQWNASVPVVNIIAPLGLSYYTFNSIGYLIDVGRGKIEAEKHLGKFALFVSFFPSIVQGPLFRYGDVGQQLQQPHKLEYNNLKFGAQLILWGCFKKLVIADRVSAIASAIFSSDFVSGEFNGAQVFFGVLAYSFQIYGDFSGGTDITRGVAQMLGIDLPVNFEQPFFATSMADFWRRWHMSLGAWMREFVFFPVMLCKPVTALSKSFRNRFGSHAGKMVPSVVAPMVVFFLIGIWHGISWQYIVNGLYNAIIISSSVALAPVYVKLAEKLRVNTEAFSFRLFQILRTFCVLCISRIIVKAPSLWDAMRMIRSLFRPWDMDFFLGNNGEIFSYGVNEKQMFVLFISILVLLVVGILREGGMKIRETLDKQNLIFRWGMVLLLFVFVLIFGIYGPGYDASDFIYGQF
ncbi:MAG: MBOAT family protein [Clostridia bacterium]|nr:MBOAT family protein [Clostridia bacterium]